MINRYMTQLTAELTADGIPDPLSQSFNLAAVWDDLCRLAGETAPAFILRRFEDDGSGLGFAMPPHGPRLDADVVRLTS